MTYFLKHPNKGTVAFDPQDGQMLVRYQNTTDPDEELNEDLMSLEAARKCYRELLNEGYMKASWWHPCKRRSAWAD